MAREGLIGLIGASALVSPLGCSQTSVSDRLESYLAKEYYQYSPAQIPEFTEEDSKDTYLFAGLPFDISTEKGRAFFNDSKFADEVLYLAARQNYASSVAQFKAGTLPQNTFLEKAIYKGIEQTIQYTEPFNLTDYIAKNPNNSEAKEMAKRLDPFKKFGVNLDKLSREDLFFVQFYLSEPLK
jgi:hypothetical protein